MLRRLNLRERLKITGNPRMGSAAEHLAVQLTPVTTPHTPVSPGPFGSSPYAHSEHASPTFEAAQAQELSPAGPIELRRSQKVLRQPSAASWAGGEPTLPAQHVSSSRAHPEGCQTTGQALMFSSLPASQASSR